MFDGKMLVHAPVVRNENLGSHIAVIKPAKNRT